MAASKPDPDAELKLARERKYDYLNPVTEVMKGGKEIYGQTYTELLTRLGKDEILVGVYDNGHYKVAPYIYSQTRFDNYDSLCDRGAYITARMFAVSTELADKLNQCAHIDPRAEPS